MTDAFAIAAAEPIEFMIGDKVFHTIKPNLRAGAKLKLLAVRIQTMTDEQREDLEVQARMVADLVAPDDRERFIEAMLEDVPISELGALTSYLTKVIKGNPTEPTPPSAPPGSDGSTSSPAPTGSPSPVGAPLAAPTPTS